MKKPAPVAEQAPADEVERKPNSDTSTAAPPTNQSSRPGFWIKLPPPGKPGAFRGVSLFAIGIVGNGNRFKRCRADGRWLH